MRTTVLALISIVSLSGCATIDQKTTFDGSDGSAFVVVALDKLPERVVGSYTLLFSRVDMQSSTFQSEWFSIVFDAGAGTFVVDELKKPESVSTTLRFGAHSVVPGDYAYAARSDLQGNVVMENCYSEGAPVFRVAPGKVSVISLGDVLSNMGAGSADALDEGAKVLAAYPKINAPLVLAQQVGSITFTSGKAVGYSTCRNQNVKSVEVVSAKP